MKIAIVTWGISHFEVPLFRLLGAHPDIDLRVYYLLDPDRNKSFDQDYQQGISWGEDMLGGYNSERCLDCLEVFRRVQAWPASAVMMNGYSWPGALRFMLSCRMAGIPLVFRGTLNHYRDPRLSLLQRLRRPVRAPVFHLFDSLQYGGTYSGRVLRRALVPRARLFFAPYGVDTHFFLSESRRAEIEGIRDTLRFQWGWREAFPIILFIAQINWFKGPDIALEVFRRFHLDNKDSRLVVVGNGTMLENLRETSREMGLEDVVRFEGFCPSKQTVAYYTTADVALFTSRYETWARAVNEAMLCARPCIINRRIPAAGGLVDEGANGYVVDGRTVEDYCRALRQFSSLPAEERVAMGALARAKAKDYSYENHLSSIVESLRYAVSSRRARTRSPETPKPA